MALCIDVIPSSCCTALKVSDASTFTTEVVTAITLTITPTGFDPVIFSSLTSGFINIYDSIDLGVSAESVDIPDGVYILELGADIDGTPTSTTKYYLKTCVIDRCYNDLLCQIKIETCEPTSSSSAKMKELFYIRMLIDAAKAKVEYCDATDQGVAMLEYANKMIKKYQAGACTTC